MSDFGDDFGLPVWEPGGCVAIGVFDGVHAGHRRLVERACRWADGHRGIAAGLTFEPHPAAYFRPGARGAMLLQTVVDRVETLLECGLDRVAVARFDRDFGP